MSLKNIIENFKLSPLNSDPKIINYGKNYLK